MPNALLRFAGRLFKDYKHFYSRFPSLHTPAVDVVFPESTRRYMDLQCNADEVLYTNMPETRYLEDHLGESPPRRVLEIGGGIGRASVYLARRFGWNETRFHMLDGNTGDVQRGPVGGKETDQFYNSFDATRAFCEANGIEPAHLTFHDAGSETWEGEMTGVSFDLVYSFLAIGYHWSIHTYLSRLLPYCHEGTRLIFGTRGVDRGGDFAFDEVRRLDPATWQVVANVRESELERASILVLQPAAGALG